MQCSRCDITMKSFCYKRGSGLNMRISGEKLEKLYRIYSFTCTWYEFLAYDSLKLIFLWLLMFRWAMWSKGLLLLQCYLVNLIAVLTLHIAIIQYCFYFRQCFCSEIVSFFVPKYQCIKKFLCLSIFLST